MNEKKSQKKVEVKLKDEDETAEENWLEQSQNKMKQTT